MAADLRYDQLPNVFSGVRFVLIGFDSINKPMVLSKLIDGGGVDVGHYGPNCTHVIVDKLVYDDPLCVGARNDEKTVVNGLWVVHSFDVGMLVDHTSILYRPLRDLKGVPDAESLVVCLTGYQRHDREDIMTMVSLMGAKFSKPLIANKVTHLICYKFEGEKYELAKRMKTIKLVNHLWLEDCLKVWKILPEVDYAKSGYELEVLEAEAKDSEEETDAVSNPHDFMNPNQELRKNQLDSSASRGWSDAVNIDSTISAAGRERISVQGSSLPKALDCGDAGRAFGNASYGESLKNYERTEAPVTVGYDLACTSGKVRSPHSDLRKLSPKNYSRKKMDFGGMVGNLSTVSTVNTSNYNVNNSSEIAMTKTLKNGTENLCIRTPSRTMLHHKEKCSIIDEKRMDISSGTSISEKTVHNSKAGASGGSAQMNRNELLKPASLITVQMEANYRGLSSNDAHCSNAAAALSTPPRISKLRSSGVNRKSPTSGTPVSKCVNPETAEEALVTNADGHVNAGVATGEIATCMSPRSKKLDYSSEAAPLNTPQRSSPRISKLMSSSVGRKSPTSGTPSSKVFNPEIRQDKKLEEALLINATGSGSADVAPGETSKLSSPGSKILEMENSNDTYTQSMQAGAHMKQPARNMFGRESLSKGNTSNMKGSILLNERVYEDDPAIHSTDACKRLGMVPSTVNCTVLVAPTKDVSQSKNTIQQHCLSMDDETEAPEDAEENDVRVAVSEEKNGEDEPSVVVEADKSEDLLTNEIDGNALGVRPQNTMVNKDKDGTKQRKATCIKTKLGESTIMHKEAKENPNRGKKRLQSKINRTAFPSKALEVEEVPKAISEENHRQVEAEITGVQHTLGDSHKASADEKDVTKKKKVTRGKRKLGESPHMEKIVKKNFRREKGTPGKIKKLITREVLESKEENEVTGAIREENNGTVEPDIVEKLAAQDKSEGVRLCEADCTTLTIYSCKIFDEDKDGTKKKKTACGIKRKLGQSTHIEDVVNEKKKAGGKCPLGKIREGEGVSVSSEKTESGKEGSVQVMEAKKKTGSVSKLTYSLEKDNKNMATSRDQSVRRGKKQVGKLVSKASNKFDALIRKSNPDSMQVQTSPRPEPVWFILTGHVLQRKEFQQVIRRLKGKVCKVSHQWSYQATHFILPDPVRRTEKFFAAAASGRWILKTDYLSDSNREGRWLAEEPYEWYKSGLSEDGAINLEAPRKWRLQRERTGHGAFYKMNIIIYGDCVSPSLDTLKRVLKAGDGTILATSPPYTRFLESGVDFAVVSPGMLHVDMWIQEFLRHQIPCVVADYLVEFVCKPGYSLERHVQYNTHAWAEKAFENLVRQSEEVVVPSAEEVGPMTQPKADGGSDASDIDLPCQVCRSRDREEEMLICGDESGSSGCGIGMHIDCCDPPLKGVPEEDWFCPKCSESKSSKKPPKSAKKGTPVTRRK